MQNVKKHIRTSHLIAVMFMCMLIAGIVFFAVPKKQSTALAAGLTPFGGLSTYVFYCTCSSNIAITINDLTISPPLTLPIIYQPGGTTLYPYGQVFSAGVWLLGLWNTGGNCQYYVGKGCSSYTTQGTMSMVGTSM